MTAIDLNSLIEAADLTDRTDRLMLADAYEEEGRDEEARLLRMDGVSVWCGKGRIRRSAADLSVLVGAAENTATKIGWYASQTLYPRVGVDGWFVSYRVEVEYMIGGEWNRLNTVADFSGVEAVRLFDYKGKTGVACATVKELEVEEADWIKAIDAIFLGRE